MDSTEYTFSYASPSWIDSIRAFLSQFSNVFSAFSPHIAPTYQHDRCERSVQMRLYSLSKRQFVLVFATFFCCFGVSVLIGVAGPPIIESVSQNASSLRQMTPDLKTGPFHLKSPPMSTFHQQLWLIASIYAENSELAKFEQEFTVSVQIRAIQKDEKLKELFDNPNLTGEIHNHTRNLRCTHKCDDLILMHLGFLDYSNYIITVRFFGLENLKYKIENIDFHFKSYNVNFTQLEIWLRFVFLVFTFLTSCMFAHSLRKFSIKDWSIEQRWIAILLPLLLVYNDPIFPLTFLVNSWLPGMLDGLFQGTFLCALLLFWLCLYHGVRQTDRQFSKFYLPKLIVVGLLWLAAVTLASWEQYNELRDPTFYYRLDQSNFMGFKICFFVVGGIYLVYLGYLLIQAFAELQTMPYFDIRLKFLTVFMLIILAVSVAITYLRFGGSMLQDNFVSELTTRYQNSVEFVSFYGLLNFYLYTMAFVYSPSKNAIYETHFKDNPALSMLNDSDEEVHYGSDQEEVSLTSRQRQNRYDTDDDTFH
ncbi:transmembrane protein 181-like isoform X1 [Argonauta hians]